MSAEPGTTRTLWVIDDDLMSREVLALIGAEAGFVVETFESGEAALEALAGDGATQPDAVLTDMQMPGISGESLARLLRAHCGAGTRLLAMSGSEVAPEQTAAFDGFLLKPFSMDELKAALGSFSTDAKPVVEVDEVLSKAVYTGFARSMSQQQLKALYAMSLDDAESRIKLMRKALAADDDSGYRRAAHAIKGGCGMVGALELARLAAVMEEHGLKAVDNIGPPQKLLDEFMAASQRLRRILDAQSVN